MAASRDPHAISSFSEDKLEQLKLSLRIQRINNSYGTRFCNILKTLLLQEDKITPKEYTKKYHDLFGFLHPTNMGVFRDIHLCHANLQNATSQLETAKDVEEGERSNKGGGIDKDVADEVDTHQANLKQLNKQLKDLEDKSEQELKQIDKDLNEISDLNVQETEKLTETDASVVALNAQQGSANSIFEIKKEEYQSKCDCCGCLPSRVLKEKLAYEEAKKNLVAIDQQIVKASLLSTERRVKICQFEAKQVELKNSRSAIEKAKPSQGASLKEQIKAEESKYESAEAKEKLQKTRENAKISNTNMLLYLRAYVCYLELEKSIINASKTGPGDIFAPLKELLTADRIMLSEYMEKLWCEDFDRKKGMMIYSNMFVRLSPAAQQAFCAGKIVPELQNAVVPASFDVSDVGHSVMFSQGAQPVAKATAAAPALTIQRS